MKESQSLTNNLLMEVDVLSNRLRNIKQSYKTTENKALKGRLFTENENIFKRVNEIQKIAELLNRKNENIGFDAVNEWTFQLLRISHLGNAEQRLQALVSILVNRLGRRCGQWCELPFRLTHERIGELIGSTRVTSTRLISKLRSSELLIAPIGTQTVSVAPSFIETSPL